MRLNHFQLTTVDVVRHRDVFSSLNGMQLRSSVYVTVKVPSATLLSATLCRRTLP